MKLVIEDDVITQAGHHVTWVEPGEYNVIRLFDRDRVIIDVTTPTSMKRQITIVPLHKGTLVNEEDPVS